MSILSPPPPRPAPALDEQIRTTSRFCQSRLKKTFLPPLFENGFLMVHLPWTLIHRGGGEG